MQKKAEAYKQYTNAAVAEMLINVLPQIAGNIAQPLSQIDKIVIMDGGSGNGNGVGSVAGNVTGVMAQVFESMKEITGIDLQEIVKAQGYDAKVNRNINISTTPGAAEAIKDVVDKTTE
jgi:flotillin